MDGTPIDQEAVKAARRLLAAHHPIGVADLAELLAKEGVCAPEGQNPLRWVCRHLSAASTHRSVTWELPDMRLVDIDRLCEGLVLTRNVLATELNTGVAEIEPDLIPLLLISQLDDPEGDDAYVALAGGGRAELGQFFTPDDELGLAGPPGWLGNPVIGDALAFTITNGEVSVTHLGEEPPWAEEPVEALRSAYEQACQTGAGYEGAVEILDVFVIALAEHPGLFLEPLPPLRRLLAAAGLAFKGKWVRRLAGPSEDPCAPDDLSLTALQIVLAVYRLAVLGRASALEELGLPPATLARMLSCRLVAPTFASQMIQLGDEPLVAAFAWSLRGEHAWNAGPSLALAMCAEARGDALSGEAYLAEALRADPCHKDSLLQAAWYAEDRGDAAGAVDFLRQAGVGDPPQVRFLQRFAAPGPVIGPLKEPCLCGSGRAHGHCCAHRNGHPLHERAQWLYRKAVRYLLQPVTELAVRGIAEARTQGDDRPLAWMRAALIDPFTQDLALFEGGLLEEFLDVRGVLLPADELALGRSWVGIRRGLHEVVSIDADDRRLRLRDLATGRHVDVPAEAGIRYVPGLLLYARMAPDGRAQRMLDVLPVAANLRDPLLELLDKDPDPVEIMTWFRRSGDAPDHESP
ncbi:MAG: YecA family protein [Egibacteraceae bacterium]